MSNKHQILIISIALATSTLTLVACGQKGNLMLPRDPAAVGRATLPQTLVPELPTLSTLESPPPATSASSPLP